MRLFRGRTGDRIVLAERLQSGARIIAEESTHPCADVIREVLDAGIDLGTGREVVGLDEITPLAPVANPGKIVCVGLNYAEHTAETGLDEPTAPVLFAKFPNTLRAHGEVVEVPAASALQLDYEAELALVIRRRATHVSRDEALSYVLGLCPANDISARDAQFADGQWLRGKSMDGFCPLGPDLVTLDEVGDVSDLVVRCRVNGVTMQESKTSRMIHSPEDIIAHASAYMTLEPGDVILTGTPEGVGFARTPPLFLKDGDRVEVDVEPLGTLESRIRVSA